MLIAISHSPDDPPRPLYVAIRSHHNLSAVRKAYENTAASCDRKIEQIALPTAQIKISDFIIAIIISINREQVFVVILVPSWRRRQRRTIPIPLLRYQLHRENRNRRSGGHYPGTLQKLSTLQFDPISSCNGCISHPYAMSVSSGHPRPLSAWYTQHSALVSNSGIWNAHIRQHSHRHNGQNHKL